MSSICLSDVVLRVLFSVWFSLIRFCWILFCGADFYPAVVRIYRHFLGAHFFHQLPNDTTFCCILFVSHSSFFSTYSSCVCKYWAFEFGGLDTKSVLEKMSKINEMFYTLCMVNCQISPRKIYSIMTRFLMCRTPCSKHEYKTDAWIVYPSTPPSPVDVTNNHVNSTFLSRFDSATCNWTLFDYGHFIS